MKRLFFYAAGILVLSLLSSFTIPDGINSFNRQNIYTNAAALDPAVYSLYINNKDFNEMLNSLHKKFFTNRRRKLVFQYLYHDNHFTLGVYSGNKRQRDFPDHEQFILTPGTTCNKVEIGNDVYLGDLEIESQKNNLDTLRKLAAKPKENAFFVFVPSIDTKTIPGKKVIRFEIFTVSNSDDICTQKWNATTGTHTNPAPPRGGN